MARRGTERSFCAAESSRKCRGDYYSEGHHRDVDERRKRQRYPRQPRDDCYAEPLHPYKDTGHRLASDKPIPESRGARNRYDRMAKTDAPYMSYRVGVETDEKAMPSSANAAKKDGKHGVDAGEGSVVAGVSQSSYYGDTSVEGISVIGKSTSSPPKQNDARKNGERGACKGDVAYKEVNELSRRKANQKAKNGAGAMVKNGDHRSENAPDAYTAVDRGLNGRRHSAPESDVLATGATPRQAKTEPYRGNHNKEKTADPARPLGRPFCEKPLGGPFGDEPDLEGLLPADTNLAKLEKDAGPFYATTKAKALPVSEDTIQVSSESSMVGVPAPGPLGRPSDKGPSTALLNSRERSNRPVQNAERKDFSVAAEDSFIDRKAVERQSSKRNGQKALPVVEEPMVVPAVAEVTKATKAHPRRRNGGERSVVKSQAVMTGERYPLGRDSYHGRGMGMTTRNGRYQRHSDDNAVPIPADLHEDIDVTDDELNGLPDWKKKNSGARRNGETNEGKSDSTLQKASQPQTGRGGGKAQRRFVFKRQHRGHPGILAVEDDYDDELDSTYNTCLVSSGKHSQRREGSSGNYVSARDESEECDATEQAWSRRHHYDSRRIEKHRETEYSDAESDETIEPEERWEEVNSDKEERFRTAMSRLTEENEGSGKCHRAHHMAYGGGRFVQEAAGVRRKIISGAKLHEREFLEASLGDESPSLDKHSHDWSIVSSEENVQDNDNGKRRWVTKSEKDEGTTSFSVDSSRWLTPPLTRQSESSSGQPASSRLDAPLMGDFRSRRNVVLRRSNSALHTCLQNLRSSSGLQASGPVLVLLGGINPQDPMREDLGSAVIRYLFDEDTWELCSFLPHARSYHTAAYVEDRIYVIGGFNLDALEYEGPAPSAACFCLDVRKMSWKNCAPMNHARACHACVTVGRGIYVAGGKDNAGRITDTVECFDVTTGRWNRLPNLPRPLMASGAAYYDSRIWILGGVTSSAANRCRVTYAVYEFDLEDGRWFQAVSLWAPLAYSLALTTVDSSGEERLWLWGGMDEDGRSWGELRLWRPKRRTWLRRCRLQPARHAFCGAVVGKLMCLLGGIESRFRAATDAHTQMDLTQNALCSGCPVPYPVTGASAVVVPPKERSPSLRIAQSEEDSSDGATLKMRTVYRRYRQRRKVKEADELDDSQFPVVGVFESTRILDSTFDSTTIRRQDISREKSPDFGTKEERLALELRNSSRQRRKELVNKREAMCSEAASRGHWCRILSPAIDPNCGLALHVEGEDETCSAGCADTAMAIQSIRPCKNVSSEATWAVLSFGGIDLHRPACHEIGRLALYFRPLKNGWELLDAMPAPRNYHTASLVGDEVFVVGGCDPGRSRCDEMVASDSVFCFSTSRRSWCERAKVPEARAFHGAAVLGDRIYVVGGRDQNGRYLDTVAMYSPMLDSWSVLLNMPLALMGAAVVAYQGRIWVLGGIGFDRNDSSTQAPKERTLDDVFVIDTRSARCRAGPGLPYPCAFAAAAVCGDQIWLCGGMTPGVNGKPRSTSNVYVLEDGGAWAFYDLLALNRHAFPAVSYADAFVLLLGGVTTSCEGSVDECEVFYTGPGHGTLRLRPLPFALAGHASVVLQPSGDNVPDVRDVWRHLCEAAERS